MTKCYEPLRELLPESIKYDKTISDMTTAIQDQLNDICKNTSLVELYSNIDNLPESILRLLAWENGLDGPEWVLAKTIENKRDLVRDSFMLNKRRGTRWSVERIFTILDLKADIVEWWENDAVPFTFRINISDLNGRGISYDEIDTVNQLVDLYKPLTRHNSEVNLSLFPDTIKGNVLMMVQAKAKLTV